MEDKHHKRLMRWANRGLLALEGILIGISCAVVICLFRLSLDSVTSSVGLWLGSFRLHWWIVPLWLCIIIAAARFLGYLVSRVPLISGSGIPQTELIVRGRLYINRGEWMRILPAKFAGCLVSALGGLSLGREGPCIQMGAAAAALLTGLWEKLWFSGHIHLAAGAAAGMTAAFGSPLAGLLFVFEEMKSRFTWGGLIAVSSSVISSALVTRYIFGFGFVFPFTGIQSPHIAEIWLLPIMGICMGIAGVLYNKALLGAKNFEAAHTVLSQNWRILPPLLCSFLLAFIYPYVLGGGDKLTESLMHMAGEPYAILLSLCILTFLKIVFSLVSYTGNVPGGILMPMLCIGALCGALCGQFLLYADFIGESSWQSFIIYGMAGFFVSVVRAPLTGIALVTEMTGALLCLPGTFVVGFVAFFIANALHCPPVYDSLRAAIVVSRKKEKLSHK